MWFLWGVYVYLNSTKLIFSPEQYLNIWKGHFMACPNTHMMKFWHQYKRSILICQIWDALRDLEPLMQFVQPRKHTLCCDIEGSTTNVIITIISNYNITMQQVSKVERINSELSRNMPVFKGFFWIAMFFTKNSKNLFVICNQEFYGHCVKSVRGNTTNDVINKEAQ